jgi:hypothetical protein
VSLNCREQLTLYRKPRRARIGRRLEGSGVARAGVQRLRGGLFQQLSPKREGNRTFREDGAAAPNLNPVSRAFPKDESDLPIRGDDTIVAVFRP